MRVTRGHAPARDDSGVDQRLFVFARHAESAANVAGVVSGDPTHPVALSAAGRAQARALGAQLAHLQIDLAVATRFARTRQTVDIALRGRSVPRLVEPCLDDVRVGDLDGAPLEDYWQWKAEHGPEDRFPHGESIHDTLARHARGLRRLLARPERVTLVVLHEFTLRRMLETDEKPGNAVPYLFDDVAVARAAERLASAGRLRAGEGSADRAGS
jgi:probable phosphoglycerate mutase